MSADREGTMDAWTDRLSEYLDGGLPERERAGLEAHLATCEACTTTLGELRRVAERAHTLPDRAPEADLWPGIEARLKPRRSVLDLSEWLGRGRVAFSFPQLAAAALALMLLSGGAVWIALQRGATSRTSTQAPAPVAVVTPATGSDATLADFNSTRYDAAIADLQQVLDQHRKELDPATVRIIEENLHIIDVATDQARKALAADPANPYLNGHLAEQMRRKVDLLRQVAMMVSTRNSHG
jgi:anti-sigma factor RsiW